MSFSKQLSERESVLLTGLTSTASSNEFWAGSREAGEEGGQEGWEGKRACLFDGRDLGWVRKGLKSG